MERKLLTGPVQTVSPSTMPPRALPSWHPHQNSREGWDFKPNPSTDSCRKPIASMCTMLGAGRSIRRFRFQDSTSRDLQVQGSKELQFNRYSWIIRSTVCTGCGALQKPERKLCKVCGKQFGSHVSNGSPWPASKSQPTVRTVSDTRSRVVRPWDTYNVRARRLKGQGSQLIITSGAPFGNARSVIPAHPSALRHKMDEEDGLPDGNCH